MKLVFIIISFLTYMEYNKYCLEKSRDVCGIIL